MRIDQLPLSTAPVNTDTFPISSDGITEQVSIGDLVNAIRNDVYGAPLTANTSSAMTDTTKIYVYTGTTGGGFTKGHWYYYNGSAWTDGGAYNSSAVQTDATLTLSGVPADANAAGDAIDKVKSQITARNTGYFDADTVTGIEEDLYVVDNPAWEQGSWASSGDLTSDYWIRTGLIDGGFVIHNDDPSMGYIVGVYNANGTFRNYPWMTELVTDEYYYIPDMSPYKVRLRQRNFASGSVAITPSAVSVEIFRAKDIAPRLDDVSSEYYYEPVTLSYTDGGYIDSTTGEVVSYSGWKYTDFIDISDTSAQRIMVSTTATGSTTYNALYDADQQYIDRFNATAGLLSIPFNAKYVRMSAQSSATPSLSLCRIGVLGAAAKVMQENSPTYRGNIYGVNFSRTFANVAGKSNIICNLAKSQWDDIPFGGSAINTQYNNTYDLQVIASIDGNGIAYRFVNRTTYADYNGWHIVNSATNGLSGKKIAIIGDSRSTFQGTMPTGNPYYYPRSSGSIITTQSQMWWQQLITYFGMTLTINDSYSGGYVAAYAGPETIPSDAGILSSDTAINNLGSTAPDIIIIFAGVNDWNYNHIAIGTYDGTGAFPTSNATFREAYAIMLSKVQKKFPAADIWVCTNPYCAPAGAAAPISSMPVAMAGNGGTSLDVFNDAIRDMAGIFGCGIIDFTRCGTNWGNLKTYATDYDTDRGLHYNAAGNVLLYETARNTLASYYNA